MSKVKWRIRVVDVLSIQLPVDSIRSGSPFSCEIQIFASDSLGVGVVWAYTFNGGDGYGL